MSERRAFGDRVRRQRERRGVTLESIARSTKVPASLFAGLERGDCARWPGGVYSRAYVRAYAEAIGLDPNETVDDFTAAFGETAWPEGSAAPPRRIRSAGAFRLSMDDEPERRQAQAFRRTAYALIDFVVSASLLAGLHFAMNPSLWLTSAVALGLPLASRLISDEPFSAWVVGRWRGAPPVPETPSDEVAVSDVARTTA